MLGDIKRVFVYLVVIATERCGNPVRWVESALARQKCCAEPWQVGPWKGSRRLQLRNNCGLLRESELFLVVLRSV